MNNNKNIDTYERNLSYLFKLYDQNTSGEEKYNMSVQINLNNFAYKESKEIIDIFYLRNKEGMVLTKKLLVVNIILPNLLEKCYTKGTESLSELEKYIYALIEVDTKKIDKIVKEVGIVEEYVSEAKEVVEEPFFKEADDHEKANNEQWYNDGYEDGIEKGIEQGEKKKQIEMIKALYKNGADLNLISNSTKLSIEEIKEILNIK